MMRTFATFSLLTAFAAPALLAQTAATSVVVVTAAQRGSLIGLRPHRTLDGHPAVIFGPWLDVGPS